jgi:hypothetical protein
LTTRYQHSGNAVPTTLSGGITASSTSITIADASGWPDGSVGKFWVTLARGRSSEERIRVLSRTGTTLTLSGTGERGMEGTAAASHVAGTTVEHTLSATEIDEYNTQLAALTALGGTSVTTSATQTLTGKSIALGSNSVSGTLAEFNTAITDADLASLATAQTLTNKTLTAPALTAPTASGSLTGFGGAWTPWTPTLSNFTLGNGTMSGAYIQIGKTVHWRLSVVFGSTTVPGIDPSFSVPVAEVASSVQTGAAHMYDASTASLFYGSTRVNSGVFQFISAGGIMGAAVPFTWATSDQLSGGGTYEAA